MSWKRVSCSFDMTICFFAMIYTDVNNLTNDRIDFLIFFKQKTMERAKKKWSRDQCICNLFRCRLVFCCNVDSSDTTTPWTNQSQLLMLCV